MINNVMSIEELKRCTSWFLIIGVLSIINLVVWWFELVDVYFVTGLELTQLVDAFVIEFIGESGVFLALLLDTLISGFFILTATLTNKGYRFIYYIAITLYIIDTLILLVFEDYLSVGFHVFALIFIFKGVKIIKYKNENNDQIDYPE